MGVTLCQCGFEVRGGADESEFGGAYVGALLSSPVMASATELTLNGVNAGWTAVPLVSWLAKSPFLNDVRSLNLANNRLTDADARALVRVPKLRKLRHIDVTKNLIGEAGAEARGWAGRLTDGGSCGLTSSAMSSDDSSADLIRRF